MCHPGEVIGIDIESSQIEAAHIGAVDSDVTNVRFETGDIYQISFPDDSFDAVFAYTVLEHLTGPIGAIREMRRVLRRDGIIGISDPDYSTMLIEPSTPLMYEAMALYRKVSECKGPSLYYAHHLRRLLLEAGFAQTEGSAMAAYEGTLEGTRLAYQGIFAASFREPSFVEIAVENGWADEATINAMLADFAAWSERPDAFSVITLCEAVGWLE